MSTNDSQHGVYHNKEKKLILRSWFENEFKQALLNADKVNMAGAVLLVGVEKAEPWEQIIRVLVASFVGDLIAPDITEERGTATWLNRN